MKKGMTLEQWVEAKVPVDPLPGLIDDFLRAADESDTLFKPIDPLVMGFGTQCTNPQRAMELGRYRQQRMGEILRLLVQQDRS